MMTTQTKQQRLKAYLERKYSKLTEEAYNLKFTDDDRSDVLTYEAMLLDQKLKFLQF